MHYPEAAKARMAHRSLAYRFDMADRSIVFSGDTAPSANLVELARNADILVCEAVDMARHRQLLAAADAAGPGASIARHVADTHSTTEEVGRMAAAARVKTVVLTHLLPGSNPHRARYQTRPTSLASGSTSTARSSWVGTRCGSNRAKG